MMQMKRCFATVLKDNGKLQLVGFFSTYERANYCSIKENNARPITMAEWKKIDKEMKDLRK